jgi:hypothetical protein
MSNIINNVDLDKISKTIEEGRNDLYLKNAREELLSSAMLPDS